MVTLKQKFTYLENGELDLDAWLNKIAYEFQLNSVELITKAAHYANNECKGLTNFYGQPCIEQGLEMAEIILNLKLDQEPVAAAIISGAIQHKPISLEVVGTTIGIGVTKLIASIQQMNALSQIQPSSRNPIQIDRLRKLLLAMVSDIRVVLIKLAERTILMRGIKKINHAERKRLAQETMDIYAPLANRLGIGQIKWELEDLAFHYIDPNTYKMIANYLAERRTDREQRIQRIMSDLKQSLTHSHIKSEITGRAKHIYSIYLKMQSKHLDYKNIYDYSAVRVLVPTIDDCYTALSYVHNHWEHIPEEFDDYIINPKPNGYRSIHTAVLDADGKSFEIQIRTFDMHEEAERGVAAHWLYKENKQHHGGYENKITYLRQLLDWHKEIAHQFEPIGEEKTIPDLEDRIYVFTPAGDILELPKGTTPLDFAYHIHSGLGHRCRGAKVNGHIVPLTHALQTGDRIEIMTVQRGEPSRDWLNPNLGYIKTSRARAKIMQWFKAQDHTNEIETAKRTIEKELTREKLHNVNLAHVAAHLHFKSDNAMLLAYAKGNLKISQIIHAIHAEPKPTIEPPISLSGKKSSGVPHLRIAGINDLMTRIARCCKPIPGDRIIGYITQGRGVSIHKYNCSNISHLTPRQLDRFMEVQWNPQMGDTYYVDLQIRAIGDEKILKEVTAILANDKIDIVSFNFTVNKRNNQTSIMMTVQIQDIAQLNHLISQLKHLPHITDIKRITE